MQANLSNLVTEVIHWNKEVFDNLFQTKQKLWTRIKGIQCSLADGGLRYLLKLEERFRKEVDATLTEIESLWHQKSQLDMIRNGDRNTTYYHTSTIIRRRFNRIKTLKDPDGIWYSDPSQVKNLVVNHFKTLFSELAHIECNVN